MALQGKKAVNGGEIRVVKKDLRLSVEEVFAFLIDGVRMRERANFGDITIPRRHYSPVREISARQEPGKIVLPTKTLYSPPMSPKNSTIQHSDNKQVQWNDKKKLTIGIHRLLFHPEIIREKARVRVKVREDFKISNGGRIILVMGETGREVRITYIITSSLSGISITISSLTQIGTRGSFQIIIRLVFKTSGATAHMFLFTSPARLHR